MTDEKYKNVSSKLSKYSIERLTRIAQKKNMSIYQLIQMVCDTIIRYMDDRHNLSEEIERAMAIFEHMTGWADALNLADPTVNKEVAQAVYIFQDADGEKKGFRATMVNKPFFDKWTQDGECDGHLRAHLQHLYAGVVYEAVPCPNHSRM